MIVFDLQSSQPRSLGGSAFAHACFSIGIIILIPKRWPAGFGAYVGINKVILEHLNYCTPNWYTKTASHRSLNLLYFSLSPSYSSSGRVGEWTKGPWR